MTQKPVEKLPLHDRFTDILTANLIFIINFAADKHTNNTNNTNFTIFTNFTILTNLTHLLIYPFTNHQLPITINYLLYIPCPFTAM